MELTILNFKSSKNTKIRKIVQLLSVFGSNSFGLGILTMVTT